MVAKPDWWIGRSRVRLGRARHQCDGGRRVALVQEVGRVKGDVETGCTASG